MPENLKELLVFLIAKDPKISRHIEEELLRIDEDEGNDFLEEYRVILMDLESRRPSDD